MSALALGPDADAPFLKELARRGGGRFYQAPSPRELPRLFLREGQEVFRGEALEGRFPVEARPHALTEAICAGSLQRRLWSPGRCAYSYPAQWQKPR